MGSCVCQLHVHNVDKGTVTNKDVMGSQDNNSNSIIDIVSSNSVMIARDKKYELNWIKNFEKKLPEIGSYISMEEFNNLFDERITNIMQKTRLKYNYTPNNTGIFSLKPIKFKNNNIYKGTWNKNNEMEGYGIYYIDDRKLITEGIWVKGNIIYGRIFFPEGDIYEGEMKNSQPDGKGEYIYSNEDRYKGDFKDGKMTGFGNFKYHKDKAEYNGYVENGFFNGSGKMKWDNGTEYSGNFTDSSLEGTGEITNIQKEKYHGNFCKNEFNGEGVYFYNNGDKYIGNFEYGIKRGKGKYITNTGIIFEGDWNDDLPNGNGVLSFQNKKLKGFWRNGIFIGNADLDEDIGIDKDIKPNKVTIYPSSLSHLAMTDSNASQFILGNDFI